MCARRVHWRIGSGAADSGGTHRQGTVTCLLTTAASLAFACNTLAVVLVLTLGAVT